MKRKVMSQVHSRLSIVPSFQLTQPWTTGSKVLIFLILLLALSSCDTPKEPIVLRGIRDVVVDGTTDPKLKAKVIFYNPNDTRMKLKKINIDIFSNGKKVGQVDQKLTTEIPAKNEFTIPLEVHLAIKELGFVETLLSMIGGKKMQIQYKGHLKLTYHGFPIRVPVDYNDEIRVKF
jgi:LEA14-like dessication related protein